MNIRIFKRAQDWKLFHVLNELLFIGVFGVAARFGHTLIGAAALMAFVITSFDSLKVRMRPLGLPILVLPKTWRNRLPSWCFFQLDWTSWVVIAACLSLAFIRSSLAGSWAQVLSGVAIGSAFTCMLRWQRWLLVEPSSRADDESDDHDDADDDDDDDDDEECDADDDDARRDQRAVDVKKLFALRRDTPTALSATGYAAPGTRVGFNYDHDEAVALRIERVLVSNTPRPLTFWQNNLGILRGLPLLTPLQLESVSVVESYFPSHVLPYDPVGALELRKGCGLRVVVFNPSRQAREVTVTVPLSRARSSADPLEQDVMRLSKLLPTFGSSVSIQEAQEAMAEKIVSIHSPPLPPLTGEVTVTVSGGARCPACGLYVPPGSFTLLKCSLCDREFSVAEQTS